MENEPRRLTDEEYKFVFERAIRLCVDFIIVKDGKILLAKRDIEPNKGDWSLPGGMVRYKESIEQASERILKNELGVTAKEKNLLGYIEFPNETNQNGVKIHSVSIAFVTTIAEDAVQTSDQAHEIEFFSELPNEHLHPLHGEFLRKNWKLLQVD